MGEQSPLLSVEQKKMEVQGGEMDGNVARPSSISTSCTRALPIERPNGKTTTLPQAIAHRGYKAQHPENTMGAFRGAVEVGAHAIETDLHITKDGIVVLSHDATLKRCFGLQDKIINCEWKFLETLYTLKEPKEKMPRLKDLLEYLASPGLEHIWLLLDIKLDNDADDIMRLIASTIKEVTPSKPWNQRIVLGCWAAKYVPLCDTYLPNFPITHIGFSIPYARRFFSLSHSPPISFNIVYKILVGPFGASFLRDVKNPKKTGEPRDIFTWTVNDRNWMQWSIKKKVDGVITDDPKLFLEVCKEMEEEGEKGEGMRVGVRESVVLLALNVLSLIFTLLFLWRYPIREGRKQGQSKRKAGPIAL